MAGALNPGGRIQDIAGECDVFLHDAYFPCHRLSCVQAGFERGHYAKPGFVFRRQAGDVALDGKKAPDAVGVGLAVAYLPGDDNLIADVLVHLAFVVGDGVGNVGDKLLDEFEVQRKMKVFLRVL